MPNNAGGRAWVDCNCCDGKGYDCFNTAHWHGAPIPCPDCTPCAHCLAHFTALDSAVAEAREKAIKECDDK